MKTPEEILNEMGPSALRYQKGIIAAMHQYAEQFKPKWIDVRERLPRKHQRVSITERITGLTEPVVLQGSWEGNRWRIYGGVTSENVTHWMPLPEPPETK